VTRDEMLEFVQKVLEKVGVPDAIADLSEDRNAYVRFGQNRLTQNMDTFRRELRLWVGTFPTGSTWRPSPVSSPRPKTC